MKTNDAAHFFFQHPIFLGAYGNNAVTTKVSTMLRRPNFEPIVSSIIQKYNSKLTYHNFNHAFLVADTAYALAIAHDMDNVETKALVLAALLHDVNHQGSKDDSVNVAASIAFSEDLLTNTALTQIIGTDTALRAVILDAIRSTQFDGKTKTFPNEPASKIGRILRDADLMNYRYAVWPQLFSGLCLEIGRPVEDVYDVHKFAEFIGENIEFLSAQEIFSDCVGIRTVQDARNTYINNVRHVLKTCTLGG